MRREATAPRVRTLSVGDEDKKVRTVKKERGNALYQGALECDNNGRRVLMCREDAFDKRSGEAAGGPGVRAVVCRAEVVVGDRKKTRSRWLGAARVCKL